MITGHLFPEDPPVYFSSRSDKTIAGDGFAFSSRKMGRMAVDLLVNCGDEDWLLPNVCRIKGHWKSGESTCP